MKKMLFLCAIALLSANVYADTTRLYSSDSSSAYIHPTAWNNPAASDFPLLYFALPGDLIGATINSATLNITAMEMGNADVDLYRYNSSGASILYLNNIEIPFNWGQWQAYPVTPVVSHWSQGHYPNEGFLFVGEWCEITTEQYYGQFYWPYIQVDYTPTPQSIAAGLVDYAEETLGNDWDEADLFDLSFLYMSGGSVTVDGEVWYYTSNEFNTDGSWGGAHSIGDAWIDGNGYKHIYIGSGVTTDPSLAGSGGEGGDPIAIPEPTSIVLLLTGVVAIIKRLKK
ncbi:MAG: PEP-CTERM sorting domain-containing protein [Candidatus Auribacterota bacterium]